MKYKVDKEQWYAILTVEDPTIDDHLVAMIRAGIESVHTDGTENMILNFQNVRHVDSSVKDVILAGGRLWDEKGLFVVCEINHPEVRQQIESFDLDESVTLISSLDEAEDYVKMEMLEKEFMAEDDYIPEE